MIATAETHEYGPDVHFLRHGDREIILVGTAHISQESVDLARTVIDRMQPDCVCLELDDKRYQALTQKERWQSLDLKAVIRNKQLSTLVISLFMASYQKKLGNKLGVTPGAELLAADQAAKDRQIPVSLCDRDIRITLRRAWKSTSLWKKGYLVTSLLASIFDDTEISEEKLSELKRKDVLTELMDELGETLPDLKRVLIDERDIYLAEKIKSSPGQRLVAIVGAGHISGIVRELAIDNRQRIADISTIPEVSSTWKIAGWGIPIFIIGSLVVIGIQKGASVAGANFLFWVLAHGIPAALGAMIALAHPYTTIGAFSAAPFTSLTPLIGAGYVTAFIQVMQRPPVVREFETAGVDMTTLKGWWRNKFLRVLLVFFLTTLGSAFGTWVGGYRILSDLVG
ncbi:TraB/GumN family protein [Desulfoprunum benzoelyticum]|uniref:Pheromone shutdown-related protein TraB n=1 Tax=Desulfoprunum benzoelyticum TaxID=1506996 RepID=A0A840USQ2_9BACT|nr:TraB/GumN family protein [Desulfoprunum benzoelyticum]MBB5347773.1 pheromone shutdown-related protein TraB [Desulfoprunum benzoelyticum]MBM9529364.1 TraB/GumN family protein [Desulfoprunum benzoelyticum]